MKNFVSLFLFLVINFNMLAQDSMLIYVSGTAEMAINPEIAVFNYGVVVHNKSYDETINQLNMRVNALSADLKKAGFKAEQIKTSQFNIRENKLYDRGQVTGKEYVASQSIVVKFNYEKKEFLQALNSTMKDNSSPNLSISFELSKEQKKNIQKELLTLAMRDARFQAEVLANEESLTIHSVKEIQHTRNTNTIPLLSRTSDFSMARSESIGVSNYEPDHINLREEVKVIYKLIQKD